MSNVFISSRNRIFIAVAVVIVAGLVLPVLLGNLPTTPDRAGEAYFRHLIFDFQTLIAGILAIAAAWWTVEAMEITERAADARHLAQMDLTNRKDRLAVERAVYPQMSGLLGQGEYLAHVRKLILTSNTYYGQLGKIIRLSWELNYIGKDLVELLEREQLREGSRFFDGMLAYKLDWLRGNARMMVEATDPFNRHASSPPNPTVLRNRETYGRIDNLYTAVNAMSEAIPVIAELMELAAKQYGVLHSDTPTLIRLTPLLDEREG